MQLITLAFLTAATTVAAWSSEDYTLAKRAPVPVLPRTSFQGGWPIEANSCPTNTTECDSLGSCCPNGTSCYTSGLGGTAVCCPNSGNCYQTATAIPTCADPSWTLYIGNYDFFCCSKGQVGILPDKSSDAGAGLCVEEGSNVASTALATVYASGAGSKTAAVSSSPTTIGGSGGSGGGAAGLVSSALGKITGAASATASAASSKSNDSVRSTPVSFIGIVVGFLLLPFGM